MYYEPAPESQDDLERQLRERRPTANNRNELAQLMDATRTVRRQWIQTDKPAITTILMRYPRFLDMNEVVSI